MSLSLILKYDIIIFPLLFAIARKSIRGAVQKRSNESIYKTDTKNVAKRLRATTFGRVITRRGVVEKRPILLSQ